VKNAEQSKASAPSPLDKAGTNWVMQQLTHLTSSRKSFPPIIYSKDKLINGPGGVPHHELSHLHPFAQPTGKFGMRQKAVGIIPKILACALMCLGELG
jgi:hypothetical protein